MEAVKSMRIGGEQIRNRARALVLPMRFERGPGLRNFTARHVTPPLTRWGYLAHLIGATKTDAALRKDHYGLDADPPDLSARRVILATGGAETGAAIPYML